MRGVTASDEVLVREIRDDIERGALGTPVLKAIADPLRTLMRAAFSVSYGLSAAGESMRTAFLHSQLPAAMRRDLDESLAATPSMDTWATYDPRCPEQAQRNRVYSFPIKQLTTTGAYAVLRKYGINTAQVRLLVCEGPSLLAWVGAFRDDVFTNRERWLLGRLAAPLRRKLTLERRLEEADATASSLELALERIGGAVFVLSARGHVLHANAAGKARLEVERGGLVRELASAIHRADPAFEVRVTRTRGVPSQYLVVARQPADLAHSKAVRAAAQFGLTPRQHDVLVCIVKGYTNARISAELMISERTVEVHVTAIFDRAQCSSRAALISAVLLSS